MMLLFAFAAGVLAGAMIFWLAARLRDRDTASLAQELVRQADAAKTKEVELLTSNMRDSVKALTSDLIMGGVKQLNDAARDSLSKYTSDNQTALESKKALIDQSLESMNVKLEKVSVLVRELELARKHAVPLRERGLLCEGEVGEAESIASATAEPLPAHAIARPSRKSDTRG